MTLQGNNEEEYSEGEDSFFEQVESEKNAPQGHLKKPRASNNQ